MNLARRSALILIPILATAVIMAAALCKCSTVYSYDEMANVRLGWPVALFSANLQSYTPVEYPQCFRVGSPREDPMRVLWTWAALNGALIFASLLAVSELALDLRKRRAPKR